MNVLLIGHGTKTSQAFRRRNRAIDHHLQLYDRVVPYYLPSVTEPELQRLAKEFSKLDVDNDLSITCQEFQKLPQVYWQ